MENSLIELSRSLQEQADAVKRMAETLAKLYIYIIAKKSWSLPSRSDKAGEAPFDPPCSSRLSISAFT